jgi:hypothetical protein
MTTKPNVVSFLAIAQPKITSIGYHMLDRTKNLETTTALNFSRADIKKVLLELKPEDYSQGPLSDEIGSGEDMWVFGKTIQNRNIYIKLTKGRDNLKVLLISFHEEERPMQYPFRV